MGWQLQTNLRGPSALRLGRLEAALSSSSNSTWSSVFSVTIEPQACLSFQAWLYFTAATPGTGLVTSLNGPAGAAAVIVNMLTGESTTNLRNLSATGYDTPLVGTGSGGSNNILLAQVSGTVENGSSGGSLLLRFRSEVNGSAVNLARGSWWQVLKH